MAPKAKGRSRGSGHYVFKKYATIGAIDAIEDKEMYLQTCFVDLGILDILTDTKRPECVLLGRTGSGKTALLEMLSEREDNVVKLDPDNLALNYLSNTSALRFYEEVGVNMSLFYRILWKHILVVEIVKAFFDLTSDRKIETFLDGLRNRTFRKAWAERARNYVLNNAMAFWKETDYRITEQTQRLEEDIGKVAGVVLEATLPGIGGGNVRLDASTAKQLSVEQRAEIVKLGQAVVDRNQIRELNEVLDLLAQELLVDKQKKCYITLDRLDVQWVSENLRYYLLQALLETIRDINQRLPPVKIIIALREDLFRRIFRLTHLAGDQEEKYLSLCLSIRWQEAELEDCLNRRVNQLFKDQYSDIPISVKALVPPTIDKATPTLDFILKRTLLMPRDVIMFFNECIQQAQNRTGINKTQILAAEGVYSSRRLRALRDEWSSDYPNLLSVSFILRGQSKAFRLVDLIDTNRQKTEEFFLNFLTKTEHEDYLYKMVNERYCNNNNLEDAVREVLKVLYRVGIIGIKQASYLTTYWSYIGNEVLPPEIDSDACFHVHPAFWRVFGITP